MSLQAKITRAFDNVAAAAPQAIQTGTIKRVARTGGGPSSTTASTEAETTFTARMAVFEISDSRLNDTNIKAGDLQCVVEWKSDVEITADDLIIITRGECRIIKLGRIAPAGVTLAYDMVIRT